MVTSQVTKRSTFVNAVQKIKFLPYFWQLGLKGKWLHLSLFRMRNKLEECDMQFALATNSLVVPKAAFDYSMDLDLGISLEPYTLFISLCKHVWSCYICTNLHSTCLCDMAQMQTLHEYPCQLDVLFLFLSNSQGSQL